MQPHTRGSKPHIIPLQVPVPAPAPVPAPVPVGRSVRYIELYNRFYIIPEFLLDLEILLQLVAGIKKTGIWALRTVS